MFLVKPTQAQGQEQEDTSLLVSTTLSGMQDIPLKAIKNPDGNIDTEDGFEIEPQQVISLEEGKDFHVLPSIGSLIAVKVTDEQRVTTDLQFSQADGRVKQNLASKAYLLDIIILMENGDKFLYETVLAVVAPGQTLSEVNIQNIIQSFVTTSSETHTTVVFEDDSDNDNNNPPPADDEPSICYFEPNNEACNPLPDGSCPPGFGHNDDNQCIPHGACPEGYSRLDDDETGRCFPDEDVVFCENGAKVLEEEDCSIYDPNPPPDPAEVCFFEPNDPVCNPNEDGSCNEGFHHNDDEQCVPDGACPSGYGRLDDDETGRCYANHAIKTCPNGAKVLQSQVCPESEQFPNQPALAANDTSDIETEDVVNDTEEEPEPVAEDLSSNCGGIPCSPSEKEDSTTENPIEGPREDCTGTSTYNPETKQCEDIINPIEEPESEPEPETTDGEETEEEPEEEPSEDNEEEPEEEQ